MKCLVNSLEETKQLAQNFAKKLKPGDVVLLSGDLGAGKTTFTQFVLHCLGVKDVVTSPTFSILKSYSGKFKFEHIDAYRINTEEAIAVGFDEVLNKKDRIFFVEWAQNIMPLIPQNHYTINIKFVAETAREFDIDEKVNNKQRK